MLIFDRYESYELAEFQEYYKVYNIITLYLSLYFSYLIQLLNIRCFSILKQIYDREIKTFIKAYINYITKIKFFLIFKTVYSVSITAQNG